MKTFVSKTFNPTEVNFAPGEMSDVSWITTDVVDNERDVVVAKGVDTESVFGKNPVVMACHDYGKSPVGRCIWIKASSTGGFNGLCAKTVYNDDPDAMKLFGMVKRRLFNGKSIGFRPPHDMAPGEWGPPTPAELKARPDWKDANRVIRRCVMLEYSVCPLPMNQESLTIAVAKGLELPSYLAPLGAVRRPGAPTMPPHRTLAQVEAELLRQVDAAFNPAAMVAAVERADRDRMAASVAGR